MNQSDCQFIRNIYYMLSYAFTVLHQDGYKQLEKESFDHIHNLFAAILAKGIGDQIKRGLYREYVNLEEDLPVLRGKIQMAGTMNNQLKGCQKLCCNFDELSENNQMNQILKLTALLFIRHSSVDRKWKAQLKKELQFFSQVEQIDPNQIDWSALHFQRNNQSYRMLMGICRLVLEGMILVNQDGSYRLASFIDEQQMCQLYEKFILAYYRCAFSKLPSMPRHSVSAAQIPWALDDDFSAFLPAMQSDITLQYGDRTLIIDAKYYAHTMQTNYDRKTYHSQNLYQIFTYVKNRQACHAQNEKVSGLLLYAKRDADLTPGTYRMSGNSIGMDILDLNGPFEEMCEKLNGIVQNYFGMEI